jgi:uncharacterized membrane protein YgdD (TMEM256/DUF423 family)
MNKFFLLSGAVFAFLGVALGAFGAHGLKNVLNDYGQEIWQKAFLYQMFHAFALIIVGILQNTIKNISWELSGYSFLAGIIFFSGSLYILALTQIKGLGAITPIGGVAFLVGWGAMIYQVSKF